MCAAACRSQPLFRAQPQSGPRRLRRRDYRHPSHLYFLLYSRWPRMSRDFTGIRKKVFGMSNHRAEDGRRIHYTPHCSAQSSKSRCPLRYTENEPRRSLSSFHPSTSSLPLPTRRCRRTYFHRQREICFRRIHFDKRNDLPRAKTSPEDINFIQGGSCIFLIQTVADRLHGLISI